MIRHEDIDDGPLSSKLHKVWCCPECCVPCNGLFQPCRHAVSGKKKRYRMDGFDLDLAYITPRIIVHGFPASGLEHFYRNPRYEIRRFMDKYHHDNYKMFNFCCEYGRGYHPDIFYGRVERYPFKDHNTPPLETMVAFANSAQAWLEEDPDHVVNMHCKAGKGRAGLMCCVLLVRSGAAQSAIDAMDLYDRERVTNNRGLTVTSQRKFVIFYETLWRQVWGVTGNIGEVTAAAADKLVIPEQPAYHINRVEVLNVPNGFVHSFRVVTSSITNFGAQKLHETGWLTGAIACPCDASVKGNFKVFVYFRKSGWGGGVRLVELQHNTFFIARGVNYFDFPVDQLDIKKKVKAKLGKNVILRLYFTNSTVAAVGGDASPVEIGLEGTASTKGYAALGQDEPKGEVEMSQVYKRGSIFGGESGSYKPVSSKEGGNKAATIPTEESNVPTTAGDVTVDVH
eukprot:gene36601-44402_t